MRKVVQRDKMGVSFAEVSEGVTVTSPGMEEIDVSHLSDKEWDKVKKDLQTKKLGFDKIREMATELARPTEKG